MKSSTWGWIVGAVVTGGLAAATIFDNQKKAQAGLLPAVKNQGVPFAASTGQDWPVVAGDRGVAYLDADGHVHGNGATYFGATREGATRKHAGIDLQAAPGQKIVAMEPGTVIGTIGGFVKLDAVVVQHSTSVAVYAEVQLGSLKKAGLKPGDHVKAGQVIAFGALNYDNNSMLHLELWRIGKAPSYYTPWHVGSPPPAGLLDPTLYLLQLSRSPIA